MKMEQLVCFIIIIGLESAFEGVLQSPQGDRVDFYHMVAYLGEQSRK